MRMTFLAPPSHPSNHHQLLLPTSPALPCSLNPFLIKGIPAIPEPLVPLPYLCHTRVLPTPPKVRCLRHKPPPPVLTARQQPKGTKGSGTTSRAFKKISAIQAVSALFLIVWVRTLGAKLRRQLGLPLQRPSHPGTCRLHPSHSANPSCLLPAHSLFLCFLFRAKLQFLCVMLLPLPPQFPNPPRPPQKSTRL